MANDAIKNRAETLFFACVGQGISSWTALETTLVALVAILLECDPRKIGIILYSIQNFHAWLNIIDELLQANMSFKEHQPKWNKLSEKLRGLNDTRVRLAHHSSWQPPNDVWPALKPGLLDVRMKSKRYAPLEVTQITKFIKDVVNAGDELDAFISLFPDPRSTWHGTRPRPQADPPAVDAQSHSSPKER